MNLKKALGYQEVQMAFLAAWIVFPFAFTAFGFYIGTFAAAEHTVDLQPKDIPNGVVGALCGLVLALIIATFVSAIYPKAVEKEYAEREAGHGSAH